MHHTDVLIIGGGVIGSSIAWHLAQQRRQVLVCERAAVAVEPADGSPQDFRPAVPATGRRGPTASWASAGGVRRQGRDAAEAALASEAIARWPGLEAELDAQLHYRQGGNLLLAEDEERAAALAAHVTRQHSLGFADVQLLDRAAVRALVPGIADAVIAASSSPADGQADPALTTRAFAAAAQRHGALYWTETECESLLTEHGRVTGARTSRGDIAAAVVVLAAGAWSDTLAAGIGLRLPIRTQALQMLLTIPGQPGALVPVVSALGRELSLKQLDNGAYLIGGGWPGDPAPDRRSYALRTERMEGNWAQACAVLPAVCDTPIARAWCGLEAMSADGIPYIGFAPGLEGLCVAAGFTGHGFAISPAVGRAVADLLAAKPVPALAGLGLARIATLPARDLA